MAATATAINDDVYELPASAATDALAAQWHSLASYRLDVPVRCPHCREPIRTIKIVGLTRSQAAFTSTLPPKGRVTVCPKCDRILSTELAGLV